MKQTAALTNTITPRIEYTTATGIRMLSDTTNVGVPSGGTPPVIICTLQCYVCNQELQLQLPGQIEEFVRGASIESCKIPTDFGITELAKRNQKLYLILKEMYDV